MAAVLANLATEANASRWVLLANTSEGASYIDADAVVVDGSTATIWLRTEYATPGKKGEALSIEKWIHDCANERAKLLALTIYKGDGKVAGSAQLPRYRQEWVPVVPGSPGDAIHQRVCGMVLEPVARPDQVDLERV